MKTLYVSDLDGTLLRNDAQTSEYTNQVINQLTSEGILFSYATARSYLTATKATKGLNAKIPIICYNASFILHHWCNSRYFMHLCVYSVWRGMRHHGVD